MLRITLIGLLIYMMPAASQQTSDSDYTDLVCSYNWPCQKALQIMFCESSNRAWIIANGNYGLFQINRIHAPRLTVNNDPNEFLDPTINVHAAYTLYTERGWQPWVYCGG